MIKATDVPLEFPAIRARTHSTPNGFDVWIRNPSSAACVRAAQECAVLHSEEARLPRNVNLAGAQGIGDVQRGEGAWTKDIERHQPTYTSTDGKFRKVKVKVKRSGVAVRARSGYVAAQK